jgi:deoxyribodipyrimidine photolyase
VINCNKLIRYDPNGDFIRHFLPVLTDFPAKYSASQKEEEEEEDGEGGKAAAKVQGPASVKRAKTK